MFRLSRLKSNKTIIFSIISFHVTRLHSCPPPQQGSPFHRALPSVHREPHAEALDRAFGAAFDFGAGGTAFFVALPANKMSSVTVSRIADVCLGTNQDVGISSTLRLETQGYIDRPFQMASSYTLQTKVIKDCPFQIEKK